MHFHFCLVLFDFLNKLFCDLVAGLCLAWWRLGRRRGIVSLVDNLTIQQLFLDNPTSVLVGVAGGGAGWGGV